MMNIHFRRSLVYALSITSGIIFLQNIRFVTYGKLWFAIFAVIIFLVLVTEFAFSYIHNKKAFLNHPVKHLVKGIHDHHSFQYIYLTFLLYISLVTFVYLSSNIFVNLVLSLISGVFFFMIFYEVRNTYVNEFQVSKNLHLVFDLTKALLYFFVAYILTDILNIADSYLYVAAFLFVFHLFNLYLSSHYDHPLHLLPILGVMCSLASSGVYIFLINSDKIGNNIAVAGISSLMALVTTNIYHHEADKTLTRDVIIEYLLLTLLVLILILS